MMTILNVQNLGKGYKQYHNRWSRLTEWLFPFSKPRYTVHWALKDVNFQIQPGETMGIVGMNGAGKSTLLKIIAGTTQPTAGRVELNGRVAALLELGMGFHPEFTGLQNVMMAGQLFGFHVDEIQALLPEIKAFAEIGDYFEQPVRTYSSGMLVRLAFAVATAKRPELLIIDEALSVGDSYFQHKSFSRIRQFRTDGTTLLLVSHDPNAIKSICDRAIVLHEGEVVKEGEPEEVMDFYHALLSARDVKNIRQARKAYGKVQTVSGSGEMTVSKIRLLTTDGNSVVSIETGTPVTLEIKALVNKPITEAVIGFMIKDRFGQIMYGINNYRMGKTINNLSVGDQVICRYEFDMKLGKGNYSISTSISKMDSHLTDNYEWCDGAFVFSVVNTKKPDFVGSVGIDTSLSLMHKPSEH